MNLYMGIKLTHGPVSPCYLSTTSTTRNIDQPPDHPHQLQTLAGIVIGWATKSNMMTLHNLVKISFYTTGDYVLNPGRHTKSHFGITWDGGIFVGTWSYYSEPAPEPYPPSINGDYRVITLFHCGNGNFPLSWENLENSHYPQFFV